MWYFYISLVGLAGIGAYHEPFLAWSLAITSILFYNFKLVLNEILNDPGLL